ncbi:unnamed protein product [Boreogadus saida]
MRAVSTTTSGRRWKGRGLQRPSSVCCVAIFFHPTLTFHEQLSTTVPVFMKQLLSVCLSLLGFEVWCTVSRWGSQTSNCFYQHAFSRRADLAVGGDQDYGDTLVP